MTRITQPVRTGLDRISDGETYILQGLDIGLVAHPASVDRNLRHAADILRENRGWTLKALFGPQHGWIGDTQDNMIEWEGGSEKGLPLHSLYGEHREPTAAMLEGLDAIVIDLQDVGTRVYTFIQTLYLVMRACGRAGVKVIVLDRPNPIGSAVEGPLLDDAYRSFVGLTRIPMRHGMTIGEIARGYLDELDCELAVVEMQNADGARYFDQTGLPWVLPSPNMPTVDTAVVYPGMVLIEGTNLSEGRGTTRPFEIVGSPTADPRELARLLAAANLPGATFRICDFCPTFNKHAGKLCRGAQIHVTDRAAFRPVLTGAAVIAAFRLADPKFAWNPPPYEYEYEKMPIDILAGSDRFSAMIDSGAALAEFAAWFAKDARLVASHRMTRGS